MVSKQKFISFAKYNEYFEYFINLSYQSTDRKYFNKKGMFSFKKAYKT